MSIEEKRREAFEARIRISHQDDYADDGERIFKREGIGYEWHWVNEQWLCWNDALDSLVIELPPKAAPAPDDSESWHGVRNNTIAACRRAIESAGLKVKQ